MARLFVQPCETKQARVCAHLRALLPGAAVTEAGALIEVWLGEGMPGAQLVALLGETPAARYIERVFWAALPGLPHARCAGADDVAGWAAAQAPPGAVLRVQAHPRALEQGILGALPLAVALHPTAHTHTLHAVATPEGCAAALVPSGVAFVALHRRAELGLREHGSEERTERSSDAPAEALNRAALKMEELVAPGAALAQFLGALGSRFRVLDVGAAPGGWSQQLCARFAGAHVVAVDPAPLAVPLSPRLEHVAARIEDALPALQTAARQHPFDLAVCDMNRAAGATAAFVCSTLLPLVAPGGGVLVTLKFSHRDTDAPVRAALAQGARPGRPLRLAPHRRAEIADAELAAQTAAIVAQCAPHLDSCVALHLLANTRHERTLLGFKRRPDAAPPAGPAGPA